MQTDIYIARTDELNNKELFLYLYEHMDKKRRQKIDSIRSFKGKCLSLGAGVILKKALSDAGIDIENAEIVYGPNGKPYIKDSSVYFNLSHSESRIMCALSEGEVGCDTEKIRDININTAERFFSQDEYALILEQSDNKKKQEMFFRLWTLKESLLKASGRGLVFPLPELYTDKDAGNIKLSASFDGEKYYFREYDFCDGYLYACCCTKYNFGNVIYTQINKNIF